MAINILDSMIINRISAGEVVESPFSIVKELIDNSLDSGATKISVEIKNGGIDSIIVKDNGKGIEQDDLVKAFLPHATSKISSLEDLDSIETLGFRGEALASISNVSNTSMTTKTAESDCAFRLEVNGGKFGEIMPTTANAGTRIEVSNLFFNTPARRKFLRKPKQEESQITNIISRYILAHPDVEFEYISDGKTIYKTKGNNLLSAISCVYGAETTQNVMYVERELGNVKLYGYVSRVGFSKPNTTYQTLIINSRYVVDEIVSKAVFMAYEEYLMTRQFPFYVLNLEMPAVDVDVNVHPNKMNVKFSSPSKIYDLVYSAVRGEVYKSLNPSDTPKSTSNDMVENSLISTDLNSLKEINIDASTVYHPSAGATLNQSAEFSPITIFDLKQHLNKDLTLKQESNYATQSEQNSDLELKHKDFNADEKDNVINVANAQQSSSESGSIFKNVEDFQDYKIVGELFNEFLILEKNDNMLLVDFHAGHERLNYDRLTKMVESREIVTQDLLVPFVIDLTPQEVDFIVELKPNLADLGFDIDAFGDNRVIINSIPMQLKDINLKNFIGDLIHDMKNLRPNMNNEIKHYLMQKACKSSVKSGMRLTEQEIKELLKNLDIKHPVLLCPHGRPVVTVVSRSQIEKWFKRIV